MAIVVQIDGSSRSAFKTDGLVDALGIVWMSRQSRTDNGIVGHHQAGLLAHAAHVSADGNTLKYCAILQHQ